MCDHSGELVNISSYLILAENGLLKTVAGGNNPDQCAASVTAICHDTISQRHISLQLSDSVSVCVSQGRRVTDTD